MIEAFSIATAHRFQDAFASQARLRHEVFVRRRGLPHDSFGGLEFDEFDTPAALYFVWRDEERVVRGLARLLPTTRPYMLQSKWPYLVASGELPSSPAIVEVTRVCVDKSVDPMRRRVIFPELLCAIQQYLCSIDGEGMIGVTREHLLSHFLVDGIQWLGLTSEIEGEMERAFFVPTEYIRPVRHCKLYSIGDRILANSEELAIAARAA